MWVDMFVDYFTGDPTKFVMLMVPNHRSLLIFVAGVLLFSVGL
jgi:hypothetical protein